MKQEYQNLFEAVMNGYTEIVRKKMLEKYELCESVRRVKWIINKDEDGEITYDITTYNGSGDVEDEYSSCNREEALESVGEEILSEIEKSASKMEWEELYHFEDNFYKEGEFDVEPNTSVNNLDDADEVDNVAKDVFDDESCGFYVDDYIFSGDRGYILRDGTVIHFGDNNDHVSISQIDGMSIGRFVHLGNVRFGKGHFQIEQPLTREQKRQLRKLISDSDEVYVDIVEWQNRGGCYDYGDNLCGTCYVGKSAQYIFSDIDRWFTDGIKIGSFE